MFVHVKDKLIQHNIKIRAFFHTDAWTKVSHEQL